MNKRRLFLQQLGLLTVGIGVAPSLLASDLSTFLAKGAANGVGLQLYTLRAHIGKDVPGVLAKVAKAGYLDVETYGYNENKGYWGLEPTAFRDLLKANKLISSSGHYDLDEYLASGNPDHQLKRCIEAAATLGQTYITVPHVGRKLRTNADAYKAMAEKLNKAGELCKEAGLKLAYHNHDFEFNAFGNTTGYEILLKETSPALVDFEADLYWFTRAGKAPSDFFQQYPGRFTMWHVKDMHKTTPTQNTEVGTGSIDYKAIFKQAKLAGLKRAFVEQESFTIEPFQSIKQSHDYVKKTLLKGIS